MGSSPAMDKKQDNIGYKSPPNDTRFKKGQSGNPKGRPPKSKSKLQLYEKLFYEERKIMIEGKQQILTNLELIFLKLNRLSLSGNVRANKIRQNLMKSMIPDENQPQLGALIVPEEVPDIETYVRELKAKEKYGI